MTLESSRTVAVLTAAVNKKFTFCLHFYGVKSLCWLAKKQLQNITLLKGDNCFGGRWEVHFVRLHVEGELSDIDWAHWYALPVEYLLPLACWVDDVAIAFGISVGKSSLRAPWQLNRFSADWMSLLPGFSIFTMPWDFLIPSLSFPLSRFANTAIYMYPMGLGPHLVV